MPTIQLRTYRLNERLIDPFVEWWREEAVPVRERHGFHIAFAVIDRSTNEFLWAVGHACDPDEFDEVEAQYRASPEHANLSARQPDGVEATRSAKVEVVVAPRAAPATVTPRAGEP